MATNIDSNEIQQSKKVAIIVAHPDDETLWAGGTVLSHPNWELFVVSLCRTNDTDRAPKFYEVIKLYAAKGMMGNMDDEPEQKPLAEAEVQQHVLSLLPKEDFDLIITHNPLGEYTRHIRHEEIGKAVINLWEEGNISTHALWVFAFEDGNKNYLPRPIENLTLLQPLSDNIWSKKFNIITKTYGFSLDSWEAKTTPKTEAFFEFKDAKAAKKWMNELLEHTV